MRKNNCQEAASLPISFHFLVLRSHYIELSLYLFDVAYFNYLYYNLISQVVGVGFGFFDRTVTARGNLNTNKANACIYLSKSLYRAPLSFEC